MNADHLIELGILLLGTLFNAGVVRGAVKGSFKEIFRRLDNLDGKGGQIERHDDRIRDLETTTSRPHRIR